MRLSEKELRDLGERFVKLWRKDDMQLRGMTETLDALGITWRLNPAGNGYESVTIEGRNFKL